jgi:hypothetical protein
MYAMTARRTRRTRTTKKKMMKTLTLYLFLVEPARLCPYAVCIRVSVSVCVLVSARGDLMQVAVPV